MTDLSRFDVVIVGAGPAGLTAAMTAILNTSSIAIVDQSATAGGQIWRHDVRNPESMTLAEAALERVTFINRAAVIDAATTDGRHRLLLEREGRAITIETATLIIASGARELFLPFPGWTLPGVFGVGGLQAMMKSGLDVGGRRIVVAGTGPLLPAVAATAVKRGADVVAVVEQASFASMVRFGAQLARHPAIALEAARYLQQLGGGVLRFGRWVSAAHGRDRVVAVTVTDGDHESRIDCDFLAVAYGLVPNTELAQRLGCAVSSRGVLVDDAQRTSVAGVYAAGEVTGIAGVKKACCEGMIAGTTATGGSADGTRRSRDRARRWGMVLDRVFALRPEILTLARPDTIICRCEDVRLHDIDSAATAREAKLYARVGMGPCQGRVCGPALQRMFGWSPDTIRAPIQPAALSSLLGVD